MFCASCGQGNPDGAKFCSGCGKNPNGGDANVDIGATATAFASQVRGRVEKEGALFTTSIAFYIGFWSLLALVAGGFGVLAAQGMGSMMSSFGMGGGGRNLLLGFAMIVVHLLGAFGLAGVYGLFKRLEWGRQATVTVASIWVIINIITLFTEDQISGPTLMLVLLNASVLVGAVLYLKMPSIKQLFAEVT